MRKIILVISLCFMLIGCNTKVDYERSNEMGIIKYTSMVDVLERMDNKETFMFMLGFDFCSTCAWFKEEVLSDYIRNHGFEFNLVEISKSMSQEELDPVFQFILDHPNPPQFLKEGQTETEPLAPSFYFIVNGKVEEIFIGPEMDEKKFDQFIQKYQLDKTQ